MQASGWVVEFEVDDDARMDDSDPEIVAAAAFAPNAENSVGFARYYLSADGERAVIFGDIFVEEEFRRQGVATALVEAIGERTGRPVDPNGFTDAGLGLWASLGWPTFGH